MTDPTPTIPPDSSVAMQTRAMLDTCPDCGTPYGGCVCHSSDAANPWRKPREPRHDMDRCEMDEQRAWKARNR